MTLHWLWMLPAIVCLWAPSFLPPGLGRRLNQGRRVLRATVGGMLRAWPNWLDAARAAGGTWLLMGPAITIDPHAAGAGFSALALRAVVLGIGVLVATVRPKRGVVLLSPIFYLCGITAVLPGWSVGGFAVLVGWAFALGAKNPGYLLPSMGVAVGAAGYFLGGGLSLVWLLNGALIFGPWLLGQFARRPLVVVTAERQTA